MDVFYAGWCQEGHPASTSLPHTPHGKKYTLSPLPSLPSLLLFEMVLKRTYVEGESRGKLADQGSPGGVTVKPACVCGTLKSTYSLT